MKKWKLLVVKKTTKEPVIDLQFEFDKNYDVKWMQDNIVASCILAESYWIPVEDVMNSDAFTTAAEAVSLDRIKKDFNIYLNEI